MRYVSSRNDKADISLSQAMINGLSSDGGLYTPLLDADEKLNISDLQGLSYQELSLKILAFFMPEFTKDELQECIAAAYDDKFADPGIVVLNNTKEAHLLELYHGPTSAFKDLALTLLPHLLKKAYQKNSCNQTLAILTATSGDTGKAALSAFADVENTAITVLYPEVGVSAIQKKQMATAQGHNVMVYALKGNFDDCQKLVKKLSSELNDHFDRLIISSANSINIGRLLPQVIYYYHAYLKLLQEGSITSGEEVNFCVPTGNFGDILAGYLAKESGLPVRKLICASNKNHILSDFLSSGIYDKQRPFYQTISPSMDILISSNLERLLYLLTKDARLVSDLMDDLDKKGKYTIDKKLLTKIRDTFSADWCDEDECKETIRKLFKEEKILIDPHTAVAYKVYEKYKQASQDETQTVILSTASPYKFAQDVLDALGESQDDPYKAMELLYDLSGMPIPKNLAELKNKEVRFTDSFSIDECEAVIRKHLQEINDGKD